MSHLSEQAVAIWCLESQEERENMSHAIKVTVSVEGCRRYAPAEGVWGVMNTEQLTAAAEQPVSAGQAELGDS